MYEWLERDATTRALIADIRALGSAGGRVELRCARPQRRWAEPARDPSVLNGVWPANPTYEEGVAAGLAESTAATEMGLETMRLRDGRFDWTWRARDGEHRCRGTYELSGGLVTFEEREDCSSSWEAAFTLADGELRWSEVRTHEGDAEDQLIRELIHEPWTKIG